MESLGTALGIGRSAATLECSLDLYHRYKLRAGGASRCSEQAFHAASLLLAAEQEGMTLDRTVVARKAGITLKALETSLEVMVSLIGLDTGLLSISGACIGLGFETLTPVVTDMYSNLQEVVPAGMRSQFTQSPTLIAALLYVTLQTVGVRQNVVSICMVAYANQSQVLRCAQQVKNLLADGFLKELAANAKLIKELRQQGKRRPSKPKLVNTDIDSKHSTPSKTNTLSGRRTLFDVHYEHDLGYAWMPSEPSLAVNDRDLMHNFIQSKLVVMNQ